MQAVEIGGYKLVGLLSSGGMGEVFLARKEGPGGFSKTLVLKRILRHLSQDADAVELFLNEARIAALLSHANAVQIFELGRDRGGYFIAMEYVPGRSLRAVFQKLKQNGQRFPVPLAVAIVQKCLRALHSAHTLRDDRGQPLEVIHRDVSPDNLLIGFDGAVKLADFGVAKMRQAATAMSPTAPGTLRGKLAYASPEQLLSEPVDARADVYGAAAVLYELLTGTLPYAGDSERDFFLNAPTAPVIAPSTFEPSLPRSLDAPLLRALAKNRDERTGSAAELDDALEHAISGLPRASERHIAALMAELFNTQEEAALSTVQGTMQHTMQLAAAQEGRSDADTEIFVMSPELAAQLQWTDATVVPSPPEPPPIAKTVAGSGKAPAAEATRARRSRWAFVSGLAVVTLLPLGLWAHTAMQRFPAQAPASVVPAPVPHAAAESESADAAVERAPGRLSIRVNPWAEVTLDGKPLGVTPLANLEVSAGRHELFLKHHSLPERRLSIELEPGSHLTIKEDLLAKDAP